MNMDCGPRTCHPNTGGQGLGQVQLGLLHEILGTCPYAPLVFGCSAPDSGNTEILALAGDEHQKQRWPQPLLAGDIYSSFMLTEPGAGADPTMITTTAEPDGDGWILNGDKWMATNASIADVFLVVAVTDPNASRHQPTSGVRRHISGSRGANVLVGGSRGTLNADIV